MHEIVKYFILTEIQEQCLNPMPERLIGPGRPAEPEEAGSRDHAGITLHSPELFLDALHVKNHQNGGAKVYYGKLPMGLPD